MPDFTYSQIAKMIDHSLLQPTLTYRELEDGCRLAREYDVDLTGDGWDEKLAHAMFQLNCDGVNARYGEGEAEKFRPLNFTYKPEGDTFLVQVLKSLQCWHYQCCEGKVSKTKLYQFFEEVENYLALKIVMDYRNTTRLSGGS